MREIPNARQSYDDVTDISAQREEVNTQTQRERERIESVSGREDGKQISVYIYNKDLR